MLMMNTQTQVGALILHKNWIFIHSLSPNSSPAPQFSMSRKPLFGVGLNSSLVGKSLNFEAKTTKSWIANALANREVEALPIGSGIIEKEMKFSPTFSEYLKAMESVSSDQRLNLGSDAGGKVSSLNKRENKLVGLGKKGSERTFRKRRDEELKDFNGAVKNGKAERSGSGWDMVEGILEKKASRRNSNYVGENMNSGKFEKRGYTPVRSNRLKESRKNGREVRRVGEFGNVNGMKDRTRHGSYGKLNEAKLNGNGSCLVRQKVGYSDHSVDIHDKQASAEREKFSKSKIRKFKDDEKMGDYGNTGSFSESKSYIGGNGVRKSEEAVISKSGYEGKKLLYGRQISKKSDGFEIHNNIWTSERQSRKLAGEKSKYFGNFGDIDVEDRAAFKTFEVFTDVRNRPRVLRMEMEERIQKLAKQLNASDVNMPEWQFSKMIHSARIKFTDHSILRVVQILGELGNWKRVLQVVEWLQSSDRFKSYKSRYIYTTVLDVLGKARRPIEALNIFYAMRKELSSYPDLAAYHCIAVTLGQAGVMKELFDVIDCMRETPKKQFKLGPLQKWDPRLEPDLIIYNAVLNACVQQKQWEGAFWVLEQLKQQNLKPSSTTYGLVMEVMLACGKYNLVHEFFNKVQKTSIPSTLNYKVLVNTLWKEGKIDEAVQAVQDMERRGIVGSASLYYDLARCLCSAGRCQEALSQIDKICKVAKKPLVVTYTGLIQACMDCGNIDNGTYIFNQMHKFCAPNTVTYNIMLKSYVEHGKFEEAKTLFQKLLDGRSRINSKASLNQKALPDKFTFNTMMEACASTKNWDALVDVYQQMLHHGYHFDAKRHLHTVMDAFRAGKVEILEITWEHLARYDRSPPSPVIKERFCMKLAEGKCTEAVSCIGMQQDIEMNAFSEKLWLNLLKNNANRFKMQTIVKFSQELNKLIAESCDLNPVYQNLLKACTEFISNATTSVNLRNDCQTVSN